MKLFSCITLPLIALSLFVVKAEAQNTAPTLVITDSSAPHRPVTHLSPFLTTLSADVQNSPQGNEETEVVGPTYKWSGGESDVYPKQTIGQSIEFGSDFPVRYSSVGQRNISVTCVATYQRKDKKTGAVTPIPVTGTKNVQFFIRIPKSIVNLGVSRQESETFGGGNFDHLTVFDLNCVDNQYVPQIYSEGYLDEHFIPTSTSYTPNPDYDSDLASGYPVPPGKEKSTSSPTGKITDINSWNTLGWSNASVAKTTAAGAGDMWFSFEQRIDCREAAPPSTIYNHITPLSPVFTVTHHRDYVTR